MGKDLRGREMGEGIMQRKDGRYSARFTSRRGRRVEKCFDTVADARKWYMRNKLQDEQEGEESYLQNTSVTLVVHRTDTPTTYFLPPISTESASMSLILRSSLAPSSLYVRYS